MVAAAVKVAAPTAKAVKVDRVLLMYPPRELVKVANVTPD